MEPVIKCEDLESDEFAVECEVRGITGPIVSVIKKLQECFDQEADKLELLPTRAHVRANKSPRREISLCTDKIRSIHAHLQTYLASGANTEPELLGIMTSRLRHIQLRLERMASSKCVQTSVVNLTASCSSLMDLITKINASSLDESLSILKDMQIEDAQGDDRSDDDLEGLPQSPLKTDNLSPTRESNPGRSKINRTPPAINQVGSSQFKSNYATAVSNSSQMKPSVSFAQPINNYNPVSLATMAPSSMSSIPQMQPVASFFQPTNNSPYETWAPSEKTSMPASSFQVPLFRPAFQGITNPKFSGKPNRNPLIGNYPSNAYVNGSLAYNQCNNQHQIPPQAHPATPLLHHQQPQVVQNRQSQPVDVQKWNISFDGTASGITIEKFFFRIELMAKTHGISPEILVHDLGSLVHGVAREHYWILLERNPNSSWQDLKNGFVHRFQDGRSDSDIRNMLDHRKQKVKEAFVDFYYNLLSLSHPLKSPLAEYELVELLRKNMRPGLKVAVAGESFPSVAALVNRCIALEEAWRTMGYNPEIAMGPGFSRGVHEIMMNPQLSPSPPQPDQFNPHMAPPYSNSYQPLTCQNNVNRSSAPSYGPTPYSPYYPNISAQTICGNCGYFLPTNAPNCGNCNWRSENLQMEMRVPGNPHFLQTAIFPPRSNMTDAAANTDPELYSRQRR